MEQVLYFEIVGTFNKMAQKFSIDIVPNLDGISIISSTDQKLFELSFSDQNIKFQWDEQIEQLAYPNFVFLWIKKETYKIFGKPDNLQWLYDLCKGKPGLNQEHLSIKMKQEQYY